MNTSCRLHFLWLQKKVLGLFFFTCITGFTATAQLAVWNATGLSDFGPSPFAATSLAANVSSSGLIRGSGVTASGNAAAGGWGGNGWAANLPDAINNDKTVYFNVAATNGYELSISTLNLHYRRSNSGPVSALLQYSINSGPFITITVLAFESSSGSGADIAAVNLQTVPGLQHVQGEINFRIVPYGGNNSAGTWYVYRSNLRLDGSADPVSGEGNQDSCTTITFSNGVNYSASGMSSNYPSDVSSDSTQLIALAWTCNAIGFPVCNQRTVFKLDVSSIPAGTLISSARLKLYAKTNYPYAIPGQPTYGSGNTGLLQKITEYWQPDTITWNSQPPIDEISQKVLPASTNTAQNYEIDITDFVQAWVNHPDSNYGMLFRMQDEQHYKSLIFYSADMTTPPSLRPQLTICSNTTLPLHLLNFAGNRPGKTTRLFWDSDNETNMDRFTIERSTDGYHFYPVGNIPVNNKPGINHYNFTDEYNSNGHLYYRLQLFENDGTFTYSKVIAFSSPINDLFTFILYPNPSKGNVQLQINSKRKESIYIKISDAAGRIIVNEKKGIGEGLTAMALPGCERLGKGIYFVSVFTQESIQATKLVIN